MAMLVELKLLEETPPRGFPVVLIVRRGDGSAIDEEKGYLPSIPPHLQASFNDWQSAYRISRDVRSASCIAPADKVRLTPKDTPTNFSHSERYYQLKTDLNEWLNSGNIDWQPIRDGLIANRPQHGGDEIRVIIDTSDIRLRRIPWQEWRLFTEHYPQAEVALNIKTSQKQPRKRRKVRILLVEGRNNGIDTNFDVGIIEKLKTKGAEVTSLTQPHPINLQNELWQNQGYDILIFTGHSISKDDGQIGWIELNQEDRLSIEDFEKALSKARKNGLQLAIFNSCDGLGLANQLKLPQSIVMREPVPDPVAQEFLQHFFKELTAGNSLFASVREARESLEHWNVRYPGAQWLPTLCIGSGVKPFCWPKKSGIGPILGSAVAGGAIALLAMTLMLSKNSPSTFAEVNTPPGNWQYSSSREWKWIGDSIESEIEKVHPNFNLVYHEHENPIAKLLDGQLAFVLSSRPIDDEDRERAKLRGLELEQVPIVNSDGFGSGQLFAIVKKDGKLDEQGGIAYSKLLLTDMGQKLIKAGGKVPE